MSPSSDPPTPTTLRLAIVAPPWFEIPPRAYGGIEWICYWLVEGLVARGHDVTLVAAGRNHTTARFVQTYPEPPSPRIGEALPEAVHAAKTRAALRELDVDLVHYHSLIGLLLSSSDARPAVVTAHTEVHGELGEYYRNATSSAHLVAISEAQRRAAPDLPWSAVVHNAIPVDDYPFREDKEDFVLFLGRLSPEKGAHVAIEAARETGWPLVLAGKCKEPRERAYLNSKILPLLGPDARWIGEADTATKRDLLARARCLLFPVQWEEPFGIVMVEAMACGTPVVALNRGSVPQVVEHETTGFVCDHAGDLPEAIKRSELIGPAACRARARSAFDVERMVSGYDDLYRAVLTEDTARAVSRRPSASSGLARGIAKAR
jgi:glycosyltransferase involved in cell wall biosynthesis